MRERGMRGFTLIELMVTIGLVAIVLALGLPNFQQAIRSNRVATSANEMLAALNLARSEAMRSPLGGRVCTSTDGLSCGGSWKDGWMVWTDRNDNKTPQSDEVLRYVAAPPQIDVSASAAAGNANAFAFDLRGRLKDGGLRRFTLRPSECSSGAQQIREITLTAVGQTRMERKSCD
ncbi:MULTISPECIES: GspH/FimT family pseudopilin [unclassified Lysobacter]|uniref:GspH/FimT family pseudopilin n=1 Tax=unclassified Lysobacter TaxID=2635362 RepID=UPI001BEBEC21|nr:MULTISPECIES: GspH/FimT family pseudopilin [unclassified Lysobacter]MBT2745419.1 GspH/FimT family pseudopilin [Lysobacter sp. ISL-42]MBT2776961.1 GspH/FimT family pseudopilin [Lysobacter sp. ISL-54]MBT2781481.1 GspH/FimT family pseudopilin [Lysobacter sp. ISL-52]